MDHFADDLAVCFVGADDLQGNAAVRQKDRFADFDFLRQLGIVDVDSFRRAEDGLVADRKLGVVLKQDRFAAAHLADSELRSLQVLQDRDGLAGFLGGHSYVSYDLVLLLVRTVREIQARHVHAALDELPDLLLSGNGRAHGADDLGASNFGRLAEKISE